MSGTKIYYWDACAYLAWLKNEEAAYGKDSIEALGNIIKENLVPLISDEIGRAHV